MVEIISLQIRDFYTQALMITNFFTSQINDAYHVYKKKLISKLVAGQSLERNSEDISILMGRGVEMARSESIQESINTLQGYIDHYGQYR
jgi:oligoendopeptidase F